MSPQNLRGRRILIVEDEIMIAMMLENALTDAGCDVVGPCATVGEAESNIDFDELDGAILDINLRGESSFGLARRLMEHHVPLVVVSGYNSDVVPHDVQVDFFHEKPFQSAAILCSLSDAIRIQPAAPSGQVGASPPPKPPTRPADPQHAGRPLPRSVPFA